MKTVSEVAAKLEISPSRVIQLIRQGTIKAKKFGSKNWLIVNYSAAFKRAGPGRPKKKGS